MDPQLRLQLECTFEALENGTSCFIQIPKSLKS